MPEIRTVIVASRFKEGGVDAVGRLQLGDLVVLSREPNNPADPLAVACHFGHWHLGYIPKPANAGIAAALDDGLRPTAAVTEAAIIDDRLTRVVSAPHITVSWDEGVADQHEAGLRRAARGKK